MKKISMIKISIFLILNICFAYNKVAFSANDDSIQKTLDQLVKDNGIPGLNFSIIYEDGEQFNYSSGYADTLNKTELNSNHVMFSGSIGKTYAVAIIMQLVEEGRIDLKSKFINYFPDNDWLLKLPNIQDVSVEMLLQHTSGLPRYINHQEVWDTVYNNPDKVWTYKDRLSFIFNDKPLHPAGKGWAYSDTNYLLIGMLIEKITGSYYYDEVKNRILIPMKLEKTHPSIQRDIPNLPTAYSNLQEFFSMPGVVVTDGKYCFNPQMEWTGGGMASTTSDLAKWAKIYFENKLFSKESLTKIVTPNSNGKMIDEGLSYGMGSFIYHTKSGIVYGHTGFMPGFNSIFAYFPDHKIAVALQINCDYASSKISLVDYLDIILTTLNEN